MPTFRFSDLLEEPEVEEFRFSDLLSEPVGSISATSVPSDSIPVRFSDLIAESEPETFEMLPAHGPTNDPRGRQPSASELQFFNENKDVAGYAAEDDSVVFNPFARLTPEGQDAIYQNESSRIFMRKSGVRPKFALSDEQKRLFADYSDDDQDKRETIAARILSGDPSSGTPTEEQIVFVDRLRRQMAQPPTREGTIHVPPPVDQDKQAVERMAAIFDEAEKERKKSDPSVVERWLAPVEPEKGGVMGVAANVRPDKVIGQIVSFFVDVAKTAGGAAAAQGVPAQIEAGQKVLELIGGLGKFGWDYAKYGTIMAGLGPDGWAPYQDIISRKASGKPMTLDELRAKYPTFAEAAEAVYANPAGPFMAMSMVKGVIPGKVGARVAETPAESAALVKQANRALPDIQANVAEGRVQRGLDRSAERPRFDETIPRTSEPPVSPEPVRLSDLTKEPTPEATVPLENVAGAEGTRSQIVDADDLIFRETEQNRKAEILRDWPNAEDLPPIVAVETAQGLEILDGHNRASVARDFNKTVEVLSIDEPMYQSLIDKGYDGIDIAAGVLELNKRWDDLSNLNSQFAGSHIHKVAHDVADIIAAGEGAAAVGKIAARNVAGGLQEKAKRHFGVTQNAQEAGYILDDGSMLDFSGRHYATGYERGTPKAGQPDYLRGSRNTDHREVGPLFDNEAGGISGTDAMMRFEIEGNAIRLMPQGDSFGISFVKGQSLTDAQWGKIATITKESAGPNYVDLYKVNGDRIASTEFNTVGELRRFYEKHGLAAGEGAAAVPKDVAQQGQKAPAPPDLKSQPVISETAPPRPSAQAAAIAPEPKPKIAPRAIELTEAPTTVPVKEAKPPKVEPPPKPISELDNVVGLRHEDINATRERVGLPKLEKAEAETQQQWFDEATTTGAMHTAIESARESARTGRAQTPVEHMGAVQKAAQLETGIKESMERAAQKIKEGDDAAAQAESARTMRLLEDLNTLTTAKYETGSQAGKDLAALKSRIDTEIWGPAHILQVARQRKGSKLSSAEVKRYGNMAEKLQKLETDYKTLEAENAKLAAEQSQAVAERVAKIEAERMRLSKRSAGTREKIQAEKADIKKRLQAIGYRVNDITGATAEGSYLIGRWAIAQIREQVASGKTKIELNSIVDQVMKDIPGISKLDVYEALNAKSPDRIAKAKNAAQTEVANLKKQAKIAAATERLLESKLPELDVTKQLMDQLTEMRAQIYKSDALPVEVLERGLKRINELQGQLQGHYREIKKSRPKMTTPEMVEIKAEIAKLTKELRAEDTMADLQEQLNTGNYKIRPKRQKPFVSPQFERNQIEIKRMRQSIIQALESEAPMTVGRGMRETGDFLRAMKATADVSGTLRQGLVLVSRRLFTDPVGLGKRFGQSIDAMFRKYTDEKIDNSMRSHPDYYKAVEAKLDLTEYAGKLSKREEMIRSNLAERIPVFGKVVAASERQYRTFLNLLRTDAFYKFLDSHPNATQAEMTAIADVINVFSGRGNPGKWGGVMSSLSTVGFAPKYALSRIQTPDMIRKYWREPRIRKEIAKDYAATAAFGGSILLLAHLNGYEVGMDPRDADFGKVRIGNSRFDVWGSLQQPMRTIFRSILWATDSQGWTGQGLTKAEKGMDPLELVGQFASYKLAPLVTVPYEWVGGKSVIGEDVPSLKSVFDASKEGLGAGALEAGKMVGGAIVPMMMEDIAEAYRDDPGMAIPVASAVLLGIGASTYEDRKGTIRRKIRRLKFEGKTEEANKMQEEWNEKVMARAEKETDPAKKKDILNDLIHSVSVPKE